MAEPLTSIRNLGPAMAQGFARAGLTCAQDLRDMGADEAYRRYLAAGAAPHFIGYYALVMGLQGRPWNDCKGAEKEALLLRFNALKSSVSRSATGIEAILDQIGWPAPR